MHHVTRRELERLEAERRRQRAVRGATVLTRA
jgi:uncharacterized small protein (DUF1192 family)